MSTALDISQGGTSQSTAPGARKALGLEIGIDIQPYDPGLEALANFNTNGFIVQTTNDTYAGRTITGTANEVTVTNGDGVSGNPVVSLPTALTFSGKTITGGTFNSLAFNGPLNGTVGATTPTTGAFTTINASGQISSGTGLYTSGFVQGDAYIYSPSYISAAGIINSSSGFFVNGVQILGVRAVGWVADVGTGKGSSNTTYTAAAISNPPTQAQVQAIANALQDVSRTVKSLKDALMGHGIIGT